MRFEWKIFLSDMGNTIIQCKADAQKDGITFYAHIKKCHPELLKDTPAARLWRREVPFDIDSVSLVSAIPGHK